MYSDPTGHSWLSNIGKAFTNTVSTVAKAAADTAADAKAKADAAKAKANAAKKDTTNIAAAQKTPYNSVLFTSGREDVTGFGRNMIQPYVQDSALAKVAKGIVNYGLGTMVNIMQAPSQMLLNLSAATDSAFKGQAVDWKEREAAQQVLPASAYSSLS